MDHQRKLVLIRDEEIKCVALCCLRPAALLCAAPLPRLLPLLSCCVLRLVALCRVPVCARCCARVLVSCFSVRCRSVLFVAPLVVVLCCVLCCFLWCCVVCWCFALLGAVLCCFAPYCAMVCVVLCPVLLCWAFRVCVPVWQRGQLSRCLPWFAVWPYHRVLCCPVLLAVCGRASGHWCKPRRKHLHIRSHHKEDGCRGLDGGKLAPPLD